MEQVDDDTQCNKKKEIWKIWQKIWKYEKKERKQEKKRLNSIIGVKVFFLSSNRKKRDIDENLKTRKNTQNKRNKKKSGVLFENRPALYFCNYIYYCLYNMYFLIPYQGYCLKILCIKDKDFI